MRLIEILNYSKINEVPIDNKIGAGPTPNNNQNINSVAPKLSVAPPIAGTNIEESLDGYLNPRDEELRVRYIYDNKGMVAWMNAAAADDGYQDALQQNLKRLGFPEVFIGYRGHSIDRPSATTHANITTNRGYAEKFYKAHENKFDPRRWVVDELQVHRDDVIALGHTDENELIVKLRHNALLRGSNEKLTEMIDIPIGKGRATTKCMPTLYHSLRGRSLGPDGQIQGYQLSPKEIELQDMWREPSTDGYVWLSSQAFGPGSLQIDARKLNPQNLRFTGQSEGYMLHKGSIPAEAIYQRQA